MRKATCTGCKNSSGLMGLLIYGGKRGLTVYEIGQNDNRCHKRQKKRNLYKIYQLKFDIMVNIN